MKKLYHFLFFVLLTLGAAAQPYGNEWIDYSQQYYKFPIIKNGVYRLDSAAIANAGVNLNGIDVANFQIYGRGNQTPLYIKDANTNGILNTGDYIEFYAERNDGWMDSLLYAPGQKQANPYWSMFSDTAYYYLSWNATGNNQRQSVLGWQSNGYPVSNYFLREYVDIRDNPPALSSRRYREGRLNAVGGSDPEYITGECWAGARISANNAVVAGVPAMATANFVANTGINARYEAVFVSINNDPAASPNHRYKLKFGNSVEIDTSFTGYQMCKFNLSPSSLSGATTTAVWTYFKVPPATVAQSSLVYQRLTYPHNYNLENATSFTMFVPDATSNTASKLDITNFNRVNNSAPIIYDLTNGLRIAPSVTNSATFSVNAPNGNSGYNKFFVTSDGNVTSITAAQLKPVSTDPFHYAQFTNYATEVRNHDFLIVTHKSLMSSAQQYKNYKNLRGYNALVVDVEELYDHFAYGIKKNPLSMRRFVDYATDNWDVKPKYFFMIGKSVEPTYWRIASTPDEFGWYNQSLIPSFGFPPCDNLVTAYTNNSGMAPSVITGRLSSLSTVEINDYLNKVIEYESNAPAEWMKNVLHFGGGYTAQEQGQFRNYLDSYRNVLEDTLFGGKIRTFLKTTTDPIQISLGDSVKNLVNGGVSIMNFFGHASGGGFDISIDEPDQYNNKGKYPLMLGNSCFAGDIHQPQSEVFSASEDFVFIKDKGAIGFLASITLGLPYYLDKYTSRLIDNIGWRKYGYSIGECMKEVSDFFATDPNINEFSRGTMQEMTFNGDPSLSINSFQRPDYVITEPGVFFNPTDVTTDADSFMINVVITNIARAQADTFLLDINRRFPNNTDTTYKVVVTGLIYKDTISVMLPVNFLKGVGLNTFTIRADYPSQVDEMNEFNNDVVIALNIRSTDLSPVYPYNYAIVPGGQLTLKASTFDPYAAPRAYRLQVDTTDLFTSPIVNTVVTSPGGVVNFPVNLTLGDSMVYFWRVSPDSMPGDLSYKWKEQSFQVINGLYGWSQDHFFQFKKDQFSLIKYNRPDRTFDFYSGYKTLKMFNKNFCQTCYSDVGNVLYKIDVDVQEYNGYQFNNGIYVAVIDSVTLTPWGTKWTDNSVSPPRIYNPTHAYGQKNGDGIARQRVEYYFIFWPQQNATQKNNMLNFLHAIPKSAYVLAYSWNETMFGTNANWGEIKTFFRDSLYATGIDTVGDGRSWIFFGKKNDPSIAQQIVSAAPGSDEEIVLSVNMPTDRSYGNFTSTTIGPAQAWNTLKWRPVAGTTDNVHDTIRLKIIGIKPNGEENVLVNTLTTDSLTFNLSTVVNPAIYPNIKLNAFMRDDSLKTPVQLDRWQVFYSPYPEFAVNPNIYVRLDSAKLQEGQDMGFWVTAENVTPFSLPATDSLTVNWWQFDGNNVRHDYPVQKILPIPANSTDTLHFSNTTVGFKGVNNLWLELNAFGANHQEEQAHYNNYSQRNYEVTGDKINPLLDVTFDGVHVMDGDLVSAKPQVVMTLKDENRFLALDTSSFKVFLTDPAGNQMLIPYITNQGELILDFTPPNLPQNNAKIAWAPTFTQDGKYELLVQAKDKTGNVSGKFDYRIHFEVVNKSTITSVMNYPNPFSTQTKFVFTLTGSEVPTYFKIQIMTITGKVVREITQDELGSLHVGRNITDYAWDGRDEFGDQLANGVYLYRVVTKLNGENIERRESGADNYFTHGFGKMYLMR